MVSIMKNIEEIKPKNDFIIIRPTRFGFKNSSPKGFVAYDDTGNRVFFYPIEADSVKNPVEFLRECLYKGRLDFKDMIKMAYLSKKDILIEQTLVEWSEYETLLKDFGYYRPKTPTNIIDFVENKA